MSAGVPGTWEPSFTTPEIIALQQSDSSPRLSPDGTLLAFAREYDGRTDLFVTGAGGWPRQITGSHPLAGANHAWTPDGRQFVFTSALDGKLWLCSADGGAPRRLTYREGRHHTPRVSPDGRYISYVCDRGDDIDVVIVSSDGTLERVLNRGSDFPMDPSWSPDSQRLIWHAYPNTLMPWDQSSLVVAGIDSGRLQTISSAPRVAFANARFSPDGGAIVCLCDRNGSLNVTLLDSDGGNARTLHEDRWEHGEPEFSTNGEWIVYTRNVDGDYTLWIAPRAGGSPRQITTEPGRASYPIWKDSDTSIIYLHESPAMPPDIWEVDISSGRRRQLTFSSMGGIESGEFVMPEHVTWRSTDGFDVNGLLYAPSEVKPGQHGCLVDIHGGPMNQSHVVWNGTVQYLVQRGWVVIQPNYRGTLGYGRTYREALFGSWGDGDLHDNLGAVDFCLERNLIRPDRVVAWGGSAGAYSTLVCLTRASDRFVAGIALFGLYDLYAFGLETHRYERYYVETILGPSADNARLWHERSPINFVDRIRAPLLLLHGDRDPAALIEQSETLARALQRRQIDYEYVRYAGEGHGFRKIATKIDALRRIDRFLTQKVLRAPEPGPLGVLPYPSMPPIGE